MGFQLAITTVLFPLSILFDGGNSISDLNPNDIESVNVLKGAQLLLYMEKEHQLGLW
jgi:outer membrane receptor protein involved in Fe transport